MSQENVEIVQNALNGFVASDQATWGMLDRDIEVHDHDIMDAGEYRGHAGFERWIEDWESAWSEYSTQPQEFIDAGERVVVFILQTTTGQGSGLVLERHDAMVFELRDAMIVRLDYYNSRSQALQAAGLAA
ncbi:MAG TPA: nuclear transport factor 2 family protein [Solirubrobacteraceae bacterium]|nr:nuclear transport factor 2 family protein [Solirubrobacteraceae bacterium]